MQVALKSPSNTIHHISIHLNKMHKKRYLVRDTVSNHVVQILLNDAFNLASNFDILTSCLASYSDYNVDLCSAK